MAFNVPPLSAWLDFYYECNVMKFMITIKVLFENIYCKMFYFLMACFPMTLPFCYLLLQNVLLYNNVPFYHDGGIVTVTDPSTFNQSHACCLSEHN